MATDRLQTEPPAEPAALDALIDALIDAIRSSGGRLAWDDGHFLRWARRLATAQAASGSGVHRPPPVPLTRLEQLPSLTTDTYRYADVRAAARDGAAERPTDAACFRSSGTLAAYRGAHRLWRTDLYEASALAAFDALIGSRFELMGLVSLVSPADELPDSSLAYMVSLFARERFSGRAVVGVGADGLDLEALWEGLDRLATSSGPVLLFTTTLAAAELLAAEAETELGERVDLPEGSLILTTGGGKSRRRDLSTTDVDDGLRRRFPTATVGGEYGMTELLSQAYRVGTEPFRLPPWCRVVAIDPVTGARQRHGGAGLLRFVDLANAQSSVGVQTADLGATHSDHTFTLLGRAPGAPLRGCSLSFEELAGAGSHAD